MFRDIMHDIARQSTPVVEVEVVPGSFRWNVIDGLPPAGSIGIELGVAAGSFSKRMVDSGKFRTFFGVDIYGDGEQTRDFIYVTDVVAALLAGMHSASQTAPVLRLRCRRRVTVVVPLVL